MSLDINRVIMEATSSLVETTQNAGDKAQSGDHDVHVGADKNSVHVSADKVVGAVAKAPVKPVTENVVGDIIDKAKNAINKFKAVKSNESYQPGPFSGQQKYPEEYVPSGGEQENEVERLAHKAKEIGSEHGGKIAAATAIAAGLGAIALAKKLRKSRKASVGA